MNTTCIIQCEPTKRNATKDFLVATGKLLLPIAFVFLVDVVDAAEPEKTTPENSPTAASAIKSNATADDMKLFEQHIRPLFVAKCYECHAGENEEGGLRLDSSDLLRKGGDSGPIVVAGSPAESLLVSAINYDGLEMPPDAPLSVKEKELIDQWIRRGAVWPEFGEQSETDANDADVKSWWAAQPIDPAAPQNIARVHSPSLIDAYIDDKLAEHDLHRAPVADRTNLIRRLSFDLLGVPPTPDQIDRFLADNSPDAYQRLVDRLFADPQYGERMGRLWLDVVRYADSDGWRQDAYRPAAWRYRQWVVDAFNSGMPYDQFVALQLAGDEIAPHDPDSKAAVGFYRHGIYEYNQRNAEGQWQDIVDELTDVTADVFLATGLACAKCHDHKFDPIPRSDYYNLRSVFEPVVFVDERLPDRMPSPAEQAEIDRLMQQLAEIEGDAIKKLGDGVVDRFPLHVQAMFRKPVEQRTSYEHQIAYLVGRQFFEEGATQSKVESKIGKEKAARRKELLSELDRLGANPYATVQYMTIRDFDGPVRPTRLPGRTSGVAFEPAAPTIFPDRELTPQPPIDAPQSTGRRTALAQWITSNDNPITARVIVNRLWQYHFGTGLVSSPNDFGRLGEPPSHPDLLDALAQRLMQSGWDLQSIQRMIVMSAAYQQSSIHPNETDAMRVDSGNRMLWHHHVRRLDAEQYRDSLLVAMDTMDSTYGGPSVSGAPPRRSIYLRRMRNSSDEMLSLLDCPPGVVGTAKRDVTVTAPQSLMMINSPRLLSVSQKFAERVRRDVTHLGDGNEAFIRYAHRVITGRPAADHVVELLADQSDTDICHILLNSNAFLFIE
ncbi:PSD1 and planctomycete cytochrome C domain-containing protein [Stieleria varia]|uniref:Planctomycete cytochrome C n=1 Tax=Stieleria varia TaxID=2528005 RepID=A0A5C6AUI0_9BACT|nr:PSD1 and planctomycete cytochrome C domain-containing protein [Stieleria varia]TWU02672.1 Planctomycete cytochrome C [Stieleria varia]